jgi:hypothetical protein
MNESEIEYQNIYRTESNKRKEIEEHTDTHFTNDAIK